MTPIFRERCITATQFLLWWAANSFYAVDVQRVLRIYDDAPFMFIDLALLQIVVGIAIASCVRRLFASRNDEVAMDFTKQSCSNQRTNLAIGCLHISAVMLTNYSYRAIGSTSTLVWKLSEPFTAVVLKYLILKERTGLRSMAGVTLIVIGVLTYSMNSMSMFAASPVVLANLFFPARNVVVKLSQKSDDRQASTAHRYSAFLYFSLPFAVCAWTMKSFFEPTQLASLPLLLRNALVFNLYQFASIALLEKLDALTHSLANTMKRFLGILLSAFLLKEYFTSRHLTGLVMTIIGFFLYIRKDGYKSNALPGSARKIALFGTFVLIPCGIMIQWHLWGSGTTFDKINNPMKESLVSSQSLMSSPEQLTHSAYLESLKGVRRDLYIIPSPPQNMSEYSVDEKDIWSYTGKNLGNLVWGRAAFRMLPDFSSATICQSLQANVCVGNVKEMEGFSSGLFYWPVANIFHETRLNSIGFVTRYLRMGHELLVIGAGLQSSFDDDNTEVTSSHRQHIVKNFHPKETRELLGEMERRSHTIMTRGDMTLQSLEHEGFTHGISAGCPSLFLNEKVRLGRLLEGKYEALRNRIGDTSLKIGINISQVRHLFEVLLKVYKRYPQSIFFAQGSTDLNALRKAKVPTSKVRLFSDVDEWKTELEKMDVVLGGRIHGNMLGLGSSVPVFVIAPDYRILELVERMMIPHTTIFDERLQHDFDVAELMYSEKMNATKFDTNRCEIAKLYRSMFERYGFGVRKHVWDISRIC